MPHDLHHGAMRAMTALPDRPGAVPAALPVLRSEDLFIGTREVTIQHGSEAYRLRLTSNEKLILTK